jgi:hypothetical protein
VVAQYAEVKKSKSIYHGHRFPAVVICCAVRWYFRFQLSLRDVEALLFERGAIVTHKTIPCWCEKFGAKFARRVKATRRKPGGTWHLESHANNRLNSASWRGHPHGSGLAFAAATSGFASRLT